MVAHLLGHLGGVVAEAVAELEELAAARRQLVEEVVQVPQQLGALLRARSPMPPSVLHAARGAFSWRTVDAELANLYVAEGQPVSKGDVLARLNARGAVEAATNALQAQLKLEDAEREWRQFPERKALLERKAATLRQSMELEQQQHEKRLALGTSALSQAH